MADYGVGQVTSQFQGGTPATQATSLNGDLSRACGRASEMLTRLAKIADALHGGVPRPADINKNPQPTPSIRRELDALHQVLAECETEVQRIESRL